MSNAIVIYFSLSPYIYAAQCGDSVIILDSRNDDYISLIDDSASYLLKIVNQSFVFCPESKKYQGPTEDIVVLNEWIDQFLELNFVRESKQPGRMIAPNPLREGGLCDYQWDTKPSWQPFKQSRKRDTFKALLQLAKVHRWLKCYGIKGVLDAIENAPCQNLTIPNAQKIQELSHVIDAATMIYPKKTYCLAWAATFVLLARKRHWKSELMIGVQAHPFYAHAWACIDGHVIHDDPQIAQVLSLILQSPETL